MIFMPYTYSPVVCFENSRNFCAVLTKDIGNNKLKHEALDSCGENNSMNEESCDEEKDDLDKSD